MSNGMDNGHRTTSDVIIYSVLAIIAIVVIGFLAFLIMGGVSFSTDVSLDISFVGTFPVDIIVYGILGFVGWLVYIAMMDKYDSDEVKKSVDDAEEMIDDVK